MAASYFANADKAAGKRHVDANGNLRDVGGISKGGGYDYRGVWCSGQSTRADMVFTKVDQDNMDDKFEDMFHVRVT